MDGTRFKMGILLTLLALALAGCGGSDSPGELAGLPDDGTNPPTANPDANNDNTGVDTSGDDSDSGADAPVTDAEPPAATLVTEGELDPLDGFSVSFDEAIDPASVGEGITLRSLDAQSVVSVEAVYSETDNTLTLKPRTPLAEGTQYVLDLDGVSDTKGNAINTKRVSLPLEARKTTSKPLPPLIKTRPRLIKTSASYDEETGEIFSYWVRTYHEEGKIWRVLRMFNGPGADGDWFETADNDYDGIFVTELLTGNAYRKIWYDAPGDNGVWDAGEDDAIKSITLYEDSDLPGQESSINSEGIGEDGEWFTKDDVYNVVNVRRFDKTSRTLLYAFGNKQVQNLGPGDDGEWLTADDNIEYYTRQEYDEHLRPHRVESFRKSANDDGDWYSSDDQLYAYTEYEYDAAGRLSSIRSPRSARITGRSLPRKYLHREHTVLLNTMEHHGSIPM